MSRQASPPPDGHGAIRGEGRYVAIDVFVDSGATPLAAYQFELSAAKSEIQIVGVEGGEHPAFSEPPYYDPAALQHERIIIAALNTGSTTPLPAGQTRVARVHLRVMGDGESEWRTKLIVAVDRNAQVLNAAISARRAER